MRTIIRTDASTMIGAGHVVRCQTLGDELRRRGAEVVFVCRRHDGNLIEMLRKGGHEVRELPSPPANATGDALLGYTQWLGSTEADDARETLLATAGSPIDWVVVDHYGLSAPWHRELRARVRHVMAIDDLANRQLDCDLLLYQNLSEVDGATLYRSIVPNNCEVMLGPHFALLSPGYAIRRETLAVRSGEVKRVLVAMGGSDLPDATGLVARAMSTPGLRHIELDVVVGANYPHRKRLAEQLENRGNARVRGPLPNLVDAMADADLAIGAGGTTSWERLCLGLPTIIISIAENQVGGCLAQATNRVAIYLGRLDQIDLACIEAETLKLISSPQLVRNMSRDCMRIVDGYGASRVATRMLAFR